MATIKINSNNTIHCNCWKLAKVAYSFEHGVEFYCPECFIEKVLPKLDVELSDTDDFSQAMVGTYYSVNYTVPFEPFDVEPFGYYAEMGWVEKMTAVNAKPYGNNVIYDYTVTLKEECPYKLRNSSRKFSKTELKYASRATGFLVKK